MSEISRNILLKQIFDFLSIEDFTPFYTEVDVLRYFWRWDFWMCWNISNNFYFVYHLTKQFWNEELI